MKNICRFIFELQHTLFPHSISQIIKVILEVKHSGKSQQKNSFKSLYFKHNSVKPTVIILRTLKLFGGKIDLTLKRFVLNQYTARNNFVRSQSGNIQRLS